MSILSTIYDIIHILPVSLLAIMLLGGYAGIPQDSKLSYLLCLVVSLWFIMLRNMKKQTRLRSIGIVLFFFAGLAIALREESRQAIAAEYFWVIRIVLFSAVSVIAGILADKCIRIRRIAAAALLLYCTVGTVLKQNISKETFTLICFLLLIHAAEEIQRKWKKSGCSDIKAHITGIAPVLLAGCLTVYLIPAPEKPYDWQWVRTLCDKTVTGFQKVYGIMTHPSDDYGTIGFSDQSSFLAGLSSSDREVMRITADNRTVNEFRLVGCISSDFKELEWVSATDSSSFSRLLDTMETSCAVKKYAPSHRTDFLQKTDLDCETYFYNTQYMFSPAKIKLEETKAKNKRITEKNGSFITNHRFHYRDSFFISCLILNYDNPDLADFLTNAAPLDEEEWKQTAAAEGVSDQNAYSYTTYQKYRRDVYEQYCHSYGLSEKATALANSIRNSSSSRYEAMKQLEAFLRTMSYSTDCGSLPADVSDAESFLDHFLFRSQQGYCVHFATAFVLMANEMGIPCRYVQGYHVTKDEKGRFIVRQSDAHAWPEVYFDNAGWVAFEPTPGYSADAGWKSRESQVSLSDQKPTIPIYDITPLTDNGDDTAETVQAAPKINLLIFIIPVLTVVSFLILYCVISRAVSRHKYQKMSSTDKFLFLSRQHLRLLGYLGFRMADDETLAEYQRRIMASERQELCEYLCFIPKYETVLYSDKAVTEEDVTSAENSYRTLRSLVRKSKLRYRVLLLFHEKYSQ